MRAPALQRSFKAPSQSCNAVTYPGNLSADEPATATVRVEPSRQHSPRLLATRGKTLSLPEPLAVRAEMPNMALEQIGALPKWLSRSVRRDSQETART
jgi:hypothetical protein